MWHENKELLEIIKSFFDEAIGKNSYKLDNDDLIDYSTNPKSGLNCWVRLDRNFKKSTDLRWKEINEKYLKDEKFNPVNIINPSYKKPRKPSVLTSLLFSKIIISKDEDKALKKMKQANRTRYDMGMIEETIIKHNGVDYFIIWD